MKNAGFEHSRWCSTSNQFRSYWDQFNSPAIGPAFAKIPDKSLPSRSTTYSGADPGRRGRGGDWVASKPPHWGSSSLKSWKGTVLSLRWLWLRLFQYHSVRSVTPLSKILDPPLRTCFISLVPNYFAGKYNFLSNGILMQSESFLLLDAFVSRRDVTKAEIVYSFRVWRART